MGAGVAVSARARGAGERAKIEALAYARENGHARARDFAGRAASAADGSMDIMRRVARHTSTRWPHGRVG